MKLGVGAFLAGVAVALSAVAQEPALPVRAAIPRIDCAWGALSDAERESMILGGATEHTNKTITVVLPGIPETADMRAIASKCATRDDDDTVLAMASGLVWRAREEAARRTIGRLGRDPSVVETVLSKLFAVRRVQMGDALACPGHVRINPDWDRSVAAAIRMTRDNSINRGVYSLTALSVYAVTAQEGAERRLAGRATPCKAER